MILPPPDEGEVKVKTWLADAAPQVATPLLVARVLAVVVPLQEPGVPVNSLISSFKRAKVPMEKPVGKVSVKVRPVEGIPVGVIN